MKILSRLLPVALALGCFLSLQAQDAPYLQKTLPPLNLPRGGATATIDLAGLFALENVTGPIAEFRFNVGAVYSELYPDVAPITVGNFRRYISDFRYDGTFLHLSIPDFVTQGGGYKTGTGGNYPPVLKNPPILNEFALPNVRGTLSMAKVEGDLNSATSEWFFNNADNSGPDGLDAPNEKLTVFGRLIGGGVAAMDVINGLATFNLNDPDDSDGPFSDVPVVSLGNPPQNSLVILETLREVPLLKLPESAPGYLTVTAISSAPNRIRAEITPSGLLLTAGSRTGPAFITVTGTDPIGQLASVTFLATSVNPALPLVTIQTLAPTASEAGATGVIRLRRTGSRSERLVVHLNLGGSTARYGTDYAPFTSSTISKGKAYVDLLIKPKNDRLKEGMEKVTVTVLDQPSYRIAPERSATVSILDNNVPRVTMSVIQPETTEKSNDLAVVQFTRSGPLKGPLTIPFALSGTAKIQDDYTVSAEQVIIPAGSATATVSFAAVADTVQEGTESIVLTPTRATLYNILTPSVAVSVINKK